MWPFTRKTPAQRKREQQQAETMIELQAGRIPVHARERIEADVAAGKDFFSSDLTVREFLLAKESGLKVINQVMGTSFFSISFRGTYNGRWNGTGEILDLSQAHLDSRQLALSRMKQEAKLLGASGVIGVKIKSNVRNWGSYSTEFTAVGTAVTIPGWEGDTFTSALSTEEFWKLYTTGYMPVDVAMGMCSYYMYSDQQTQRIVNPGFFGNWNNQEVPLYTSGLNAARHISMQRLKAEMKAHGADGIVGMDVTFDMEDYEYESGKTRYHDLIAHFLAFGTSVRYCPELAVREQQAPLKIMDLKKPRVSPHTTSRFTKLSDAE
jgi:uncharacterized protein YbjQ (UPF0145 family)